MHDPIVPFLTLKLNLKVQQISHIWWYHEKPSRCAIYHQAITLKKLIVYLNYDCWIENCTDQFAKRYLKIRSHKSFYTSWLESLVSYLTRSYFTRSFQTANWKRQNQTFSWATNRWHPWNPFIAHADLWDFLFYLNMFNSILSNCETSN